MADKFKRARKATKKPEYAPLPRLTEEDANKMWGEVQKTLDEEFAGAPDLTPEEIEEMDRQERAMMWPAEDWTTEDEAKARAERAKRAKGFHLDDFGENDPPKTPEELAEMERLDELAFGGLWRSLGL